MEIFLADISKPLIDAWKNQFQSCRDVTIYHGSIFDCPTIIKSKMRLAAAPLIAYVSPANSFAFMDGGIDLLYSEYFGWELMQRLQALLAQEYDGELLVGQAEIIDTRHPEISHLISAPTMRIPETLVDNVNAYLATRAALRIAKKENMQAVVFPGMGTGIGRLAPRICAAQMQAAYNEVILNQKPKIRTLAGAVQYHYGLAGGQIIHLT